MNTHTLHTKTTLSLLAAALLIAAPLALTGCASGDAAPTTGHDSSAQHPTGSGLELQNGWAKSAEAGGMTGVFGTLKNTGDRPISLKNDPSMARPVAQSPAAEMLELHEVTSAGVMQPIAGEVVIPAGGTFELAPGGNHIMLMGLSRDLKAGDSVELTLNFSGDGGKAGSQRFTVLVKDYTGANEKYGSEHAEGGDDHSQH